MGKKRLTLEQVFAEDEELGLLRDKPRPRVPSTQERAARGLEEINAFIDANARLPQEGADDAERRLAIRLRHIQRNPAGYSIREEWDRYGLLPAQKDDLGSENPTQAEEQLATPDPQPTPASLDEIFASDDMGLLDGGDERLFEARHVKFEDEERTAPDFIAQQKPCADFWRFEGLLRACAADIQSGKLKTAHFQYASQIDVGDYFIVRGMLCFVASMGEDQRVNGKHNPRIRVIFDNGTEAHLLKLSLSRALYKDENGRRVIPEADSVIDRMQGITDVDKRTGTLYVLRSRAQHAALREYPELYKVGYTEDAVEERIKNATADPAFLEGEVEVVATFDCYNLNPQRFESLIHAFLSERRLSLTLTSKTGRIYEPREWFAVPLESVTTTIHAIIDGTITKYRLDPTTGRAIKKSE